MGRLSGPLSLYPAYSCPPEVGPEAMGGRGDEKVGSEKRRISLRVSEHGTQVGSAQTGIKGGVRWPILASKLAVRWMNLMAGT